MNELKPMSISELRGNGAKSEPQPVQVVEIDEIAQPKQAANPGKDFMDNIFAEVDNSIDRIKNESIELVQKVEDEEMQEAIESEVDSEISGDEIEKEISSSKEIEVDKEVSVFDISDDDFKDLEDEEDTKSEAESQLTDMKNKLKEKIRPVANAIDISTFTISKAPISISNALRDVETKAFVVDQVLPAQGRAISIKEFKGTDIDKLNPNSSSRNRYNTYAAIFTVIYNHIVDLNKPATMEQWVKVLNFFDLEHVYFGIYKASFKDANYIPYSCPHCKEVFVSDNISTEDMEKFKSEEVKEQIKKLLDTDTNSTENKFNVELVQISDDYLVGLREPSVYNMIFENALLDDEFTTKYSDLLSILVFIDSIYKIDRENNTLRPIELKDFPNNATKQFKYRIVTYSKILAAINSDQLAQLKLYISKLEDKHDEITYVLPGVKCTKCEKEIEEVSMTAEQLLFTRHQLAGIANT